MSDDSRGERFTATPRGWWVTSLLESKYAREFEIGDYNDMVFCCLRKTSPQRPVDKETVSVLSSYAKHSINIHGGWPIREELHVKIGDESAPLFQCDPPRPDVTDVTVIVAGANAGQKHISPNFIIQLDDIDTPEEFVERGLYTGTEPDDPETIRHEIKQRERFK